MMVPRIQTLTISPGSYECFVSILRVVERFYREGKVREKRRYILIKAWGGRGGGVFSSPRTGLFTWRLEFRKSLW